MCRQVLLMMEQNWVYWVLGWLFSWCLQQGSFNSPLRFYIGRCHYLKYQIYDFGFSLIFFIFPLLCRMILVTNLYSCSMLFLKRRRRLCFRILMDNLNRQWIKDKWISSGLLINLRISETCHLDLISCMVTFLLHLIPWCFIDQWQACVLCHKVLWINGRHLLLFCWRGTWS